MQCLRCKSKLEVAKKDTYVGKGKVLAVKCPVCKKRVVVWEPTHKSVKEPTDKVEVEEETDTWLDEPSGMYPGLTNRQARRRMEEHNAEYRRRVATQEMINGRMECKGGCDTAVGGCFVHCDAC